MAYKVMLDPGHGGGDPGAVAQGTREKDLNLEMALKVGKRLTELGVKVGYTRTTDVAMDTAARGKKAKGYDYFVSLHVNAGGGSGAEVLSQARDSDATMSVNMMKYLNDVIRTRPYKTRNRSTGAWVTRKLTSPSTFEPLDFDTYYGVLYHAERVGVKGVLLETHFLDTPDDTKKYNANKDRFCEQIVKAICETGKVVYRPAGVLPEGTILYRVQVGAFKKRAGAVQLAGKLKAEGYDCIIV